MKTWKIRSSNHAAAQKLADALQLPLPLARILVSRGYATPQQASAFLYAEMKDLSRPFQLPNLGAAVDVIQAALAEEKRIAIYGDYDVDGICASTLMREVFSWLGVDMRIYIPSRLKEGYGMNAAALDALLAEGIGLVITVDNGIASRELIDMYQNKGLGFIVTDHHQLPPTLPECVVVNPLLAGVTASFRRLCGCGTAYFLAMGLLQRLAPDLYDDAHRRKLLDLVAVATVADLVPLVDDNRILVREGLRVINEQPRPGLAALAKLMCGEERVKASDIAFRIAPCINACGRLDETADALALFAPQPEEDLTLLAETVRDYNDERKNLERSIAKEAAAQFEEYTGAMTCAVAVGENWHPGVIGIVASRLVEQFHCPAIVLTKNDEKPGIYTGSARSVPGFHLYEGLSACAEHLLQFGGHEMAAGLSLAEKKLADFKAAFAAATAEYEAEIAENILWIDDSIAIDDANETLEEALRLLEPCGMENPEPLFALEHQWRFAHQPVGKEGDHLRLQFTNSRGETVSGIAFRQGKYAFSERHRYDFAFHIQEHCFRGVCDVQLQVTDIQPAWQAEESAILHTFMAGGAAYLDPDGPSGLADRPRFHTKLRGVSFGDHQKNLAAIEGGETLQLLREPNNPADANAICCVTENGTRLGYLSRRVAAQLAPLMDLGAHYHAEVLQRTGGEDKLYGLNLLVVSETASAEAEQAAQNVRALAELPLENLVDLLTDAFVDDGELLPIQQAAIQNITESREDTCVIMPTGRGKSLIYQIAAGVLARRDGQMTLVISPLKALIQDQYLALLDHLSPLGYRIYKGNGDLSADERARLMQALAEQAVDVLILTPEFFVRHQEAFRPQAARVGQIVIDEAHHLLDKRPAYKDLLALRAHYPNAVWTYLTATVPAADAERFQQIISGAGLYLDDHIRYNLHIIDARHTEKKLLYLYRLFMHPEKTICYVNSRKQAFALSQRLREILPYTLRPLVGYYHGGLPGQARRAIETAFKEGELRLLFATTAFGEGVHISDIRNVVLYHPPFSLEAFNQLAGRCARDGEEGRIHLLYSEKDLGLNEMIISGRALSRETLGKMYQCLKNLAKSREYVLQAATDELESGLATLIPGTDRRQWRQALTIFEELAFLRVQKNSTEMTITIEKEPAHRALTESAAFLEGTSEARALAQFEKVAFEKDSGALEHVIRSALCPAHWHGREVKP